MEFLKGLSIGMPIGVVITIWTYIITVGDRKGRGYQPKSDIDPDNVKPPKGSGSAIQRPPK